MKKLIMGGLILAGTAAFAFNIQNNSFIGTVMPYGAYIDYSSASDKKDGYVTGLYMSGYQAPYKFSGAVEYTRLKYKDGIPDWKQRDFTLSLTNYMPSFSLSGTLHNIWTEQGVDKNYVPVFGAGIDFYSKNGLDGGFWAYYSKYPDNKVLQASLKGGYFFKTGNYTLGNFYLTAILNRITLSDEVNGKKDYTDTDVALFNYRGRYTFSINGTVGKSVYKVANNGFIVYDLSDVYKYTYGAGVSYKINERSSVSGNIGRSKVETADGENEFYSNVISISYTETF